MKLSEQLILLAEWWIVPYGETDIDYKEIVNSDNHVMRTTGDMPSGDLDGQSWLCLLEAEIQKDEEFAAQFVEIEESKPQPVTKEYLAQFPDPTDI